jgi:hypothetical protein
MLSAVRRTILTDIVSSCWHEAKAVCRCLCFLTPDNNHQQLDKYKSGCCSANATAGNSYILPSIRTCPFGQYKYLVLEYCGAAYFRVVDELVFGDVCESEVLLR